MSDFFKRIAEHEMDAYDSLPQCLKEVFDAAPRKVSVLEVMALPNVKALLRDQGPEVLADALRAHLQAQADNEAHVST